MSANSITCPKCYFENQPQAPECTFCGWQLLDENGNETVFEGEALPTQFVLNEDVTQATKITQLQENTMSGAQTQVTQLQETHTSSNTQHKTPNTFNLTGDLSQFAVQKIIGKGGMGAVYKAVDHDLERNVAIKVLRQNKGLDKAGSDLLLEEARTICKLNHPNIVTVYDVARGDHSNFIIMEWIEGDTFNKLIPKDGLPVATAISYVRQIVSGLASAHQNRIIHSDIKPQNIMLTNDDKVKILDFGIGGLVQQQVDYTKEELQQSGDSQSFTGTPGYMSPEQALGKKQLDQRSDIFAFGILFYQFLAGQPPFNGKTAKEKTAAVITGDYPSLPASIPQDIGAIIDKCLALSPRDRYQTSSELKADLTRYVTGDPVSVLNSKSYWLKKKTIKHKWPVLLITLAMLGGVAQLSWQQIQNAEQQVREELLTQFTSQVENLEADVQLTRMSPAHDISASRQAWQASINDIAAQISQLGEIAQGPGNYAIGRMHYMLQDYDEALEHLQTAWDVGFVEDRVAYYLALTHSALYQQQYAIIQNLDSNSAKRDRLEKLDEKHKQPAIAYLQQGMASSPLQAYAQALLTFYQGDNEKALTMLDALTDVPVWFYDHHTLRGDILLNHADVEGSQGNQETSNQYAQQALDSYEKGRLLGRSDFQAQLKPVSVYFRLITDALYGDGEEIPEMLKQAQVFIRQAEVIAPDDYKVPFHHGQLLGLQSDYEQWFVGDPMATQKTAIDSLEQARVLEPTNPDILLKLGFAYARHLGTLYERDLPADNTFALASDTFRAIPAAQQDYFYFNSFGILLAEHALHQSRILAYLQLTKPENNIVTTDDLFTDAADTLTRARQLRPERLGAAINLGALYRDWAEEVPAEPAIKMLQQAINIFSELAESHPKHFVVNYYLGFTYRTFARTQDYLLQDNQNYMQLAIEHLDIAEQLQPDHPYVASEKIIWLLDTAEYSWQKGNDVNKSLSEAIKFASESLSKHAESSLVLSNRNTIWLKALQIKHFTPNLTLPELMRLDLSSLGMPNPPVYSVLPMLLSEQIESIELQSFMTSEYPDDVGLLSAEYYSQNSDFKNAELQFSKIQYNAMKKGMKLLYQRQNYQRWLRSLSEDKTKNHKEYEQVEIKLAAIEEQLQNHFPKIWQQL